MKKGIPTVILAAAGLDNVLAITAFSIAVGLVFSEGASGLEEKTAQRLWVKRFFNTGFSS